MSSEPSEGPPLQPNDHMAAARDRLVFPAIFLVVVGVLNVFVALVLALCGVAYKAAKGARVDHTGKHGVHAHVPGGELHGDPDFKVERLLPNRLSLNGPGIAVGDVDGNGLDDLFIGGGRGSDSCDS